MDCIRPGVSPGAVRRWYDQSVTSDDWQTKGGGPATTASHWQPTKPPITPAAQNHRLQNSGNCCCSCTPPLLLASFRKILRKSRSGGGSGLPTGSPALASRSPAHFAKRRFLAQNKQRGALVGGRAGSSANQGAGGGAGAEQSQNPVC